MKQSFFLLFILSIPFCLQAQTDEEIIILAEVYNKYHWAKENDEAFEMLSKVISPEALQCKQFVEETIKTQNEILSNKFLTKPSIETLKSLYIIFKVNYNMFEQKPGNNFEIISKLKKEHIDSRELLTFYYRSIFSNLVNKNRDQDFSNLNFKSDDLNLRTETEKNIFFLVSMERFGMNIWGFMNIANKNCDRVRQEIKKWPLFDGVKFDSVNILKMDKFRVEVDKRDPRVDFEKYYLGKLKQTISYYKQCKE
jgi:hypothetical protein